MTISVIWIGINDCRYVFMIVGLFVTVPLHVRYVVLARELLPFLARRKARMTVKPTPSSERQVLRVFVDDLLPFKLIQQSEQQEQCRGACQTSKSYEFDYSIGLSVSNEFRQRLSPNLHCFPRCFASHAQRARVTDVKQRREPHESSKIAPCSREEELQSLS